MNTKILVAVGATVLLTSIGMNAYLFKEVRGLKIDSESHDRLNLHQIDINDFLVRDVIVMKMMLGISRPEEGWSEEDEKKFDELRNEPTDIRPEQNEEAFVKLRNALSTLEGKK